MAGKIPYESKIPNLEKLMDTIILAGEKIREIYETDFEVKIKVDKSFMQKFIAGKSALADTDNFTVLTNDDGVKVVIGYAEINTNRVTLPVETESYDKIDNVSFNANLFRDVLVANKECEGATLEVSSGGLARINFKVDEYNATYYLVAEQDV